MNVCIEFGSMIPVSIHSGALRITVSPVVPLNVPVRFTISALQTAEYAGGFSANNVSEGE